WAGRRSRQCAREALTPRRRKVSQRRYRPAAGTKGSAAARNGAGSVRSDSVPQFGQSDLNVELELLGIDECPYQILVGNLLIFLPVDVVQRCLHLLVAWRTCKEANKELGHLLGIW